MYERKTKLLRYRCNKVLKIMLDSLDSNKKLTKDDIYKHIYKTYSKAIGKRADEVNTYILRIAELITIYNSIKIIKEKVKESRALLFEIEEANVELYFKLGK